MRNLYFQARKVDSKELVQGDYACGCIWKSIEESYDILPNTLRQYVGENTKKGKAIWTNDVLKIKTLNRYGNITAYVEYSEKGIPLGDFETYKMYYDSETKEIIGNTLDDISLMGKWRSVWYGDLEVSNMDGYPYAIPKYYTQEKMEETVKNAIREVEREYNVKINDKVKSYCMGTSSYPYDTICFHNGMKIYIGSRKSDSEEELRIHGYM